MMKIAESGVGEEEVRRSISYLVGSYTISSESSSILARRYGRFEVLGLGYDYGARYIAELHGVEPEDVREVAVRFLKEPVTGAVLPRSDGPEDRR